MSDYPTWFKMLRAVPETPPAGHEDGKSTWDGDTIHDLARGWFSGASGAKIVGQDLMGKGGEGRFWPFLRDAKPSGMGSLAGGAIGLWPTVNNMFGITDTINRNRAGTLEDYFNRQAFSQGVDATISGATTIPLALGSAGFAAAAPVDGGSSLPIAGALGAGALLNARAAYDSYQKRQRSLQGAEMWGNLDMPEGPSPSDAAAYERRRNALARSTQSDQPDDIANVLSRPDQILAALMARKARNQQQANP